MLIELIIEVGQNHAVSGKPPTNSIPYTTQIPCTHIVFRLQISTSFKIILASCNWYHSCKSFKTLDKKALCLTSTFTQHTPMAVVPLADRSKALVPSSNATAAPTSYDKRGWERSDFPGMSTTFCGLVDFSAYALQLFVRHALETIRTFV